MEFTNVLLPILLIYPHIINKLSKERPGFASSYIQFIGPAVLMGLTLECVIRDRAVELVLFRLSDVFSVGLVLDSLSGLIGTTVLTIGVVVGKFSHKYLEDDKGRENFTDNLASTLTCVLAMLMAPNLLLLACFWAGTSFFLHRLLTHYPERAAAVAAANQKFWISRLGDCFIIFSGIALFLVFNSLEFDVMFNALKDTQFIEQHQLLLGIASVTLVLGAMTKSALFPFHSWLPNTMETPTPVSALMHAGIINAGGYLLIRMSPLIANSSLALAIIACVGAFTAFWASIVMFTQTSVKKNLAYSTIAQMGFMMLQIGLGFFAIAVVHIIGHAFYKAYAFLSSGTVTDYTRLNRYIPKSEKPYHALTPILLGAFAIAMVYSVMSYFGYKLNEQPNAAVLALILALACSQIILNAYKDLKALLVSCCLPAIYVVVTFFIYHFLQGIVPTQTSIAGTLGNTTAVICASFFISLYLIQNYLDSFSETTLGKKIYVMALRGGI